MQQFSLIDFSQKKREALLDYNIYKFNFEDRTDGFNIVRQSLSKPESQLSTDPYRRMVPVKQRARDVIDHLVNCYSAGHLVSDIREVYPTAIEYWIAYLGRFKEFLYSEKNSNKDLAALALQGPEFEVANQLICLGILLGWGGMLEDVASVIDVNNVKKDAMLEKLLAPYVKNRNVLETECTRHLPYFKTLKIFEAIPSERSNMMKEYLDDWYQASRREGYFNSHKRGDEFKGYWSWEAAAITYLLDIDDRSYRDAKFYPVDLVDFARDIRAPRLVEANANDQELREKSGQACPKSGIWETLDIPLQRRTFAAGEVLQAEDSSYGTTVWRYIGD
jgi:hypothetical protein